MVTRSFVSLRPSDFPIDQWIRIVLITPTEFRPIVIPRKGAYAVYKAYFINEFVNPDKVFDIVFPLSKFETAVKALPKDFDLSKPILMEFKYTRNRNIFIKQWHNV